MNKLVACVSTVALLGGGSAQQLLPNGSLDDGAEGWIPAKHPAGVVVEWTADAGRGGSGGLHLAGVDDPERAVWIWRCKIERVPPGKRLKLGGWARGAGAGGVAICAQVWDAARQRIAQFATTQGQEPLAGDFDWTPIETTVVVPEDAGPLHLLAFLTGGGEAWFDDVFVEVEGDASEGELAARTAPTTGAPGTFTLRGEYRVEGRKSGAPQVSPHFLFPVPISYREQVPLTYAVEVDPPDMFDSARIFEDRPGNYVAEVILARLGDGVAVNVCWRSVVLSAPRSFDDVPKRAPMPDAWPEEVAPWLQSTRSCQAEDKELVAVANEIRGERDDVIAIVEATLSKTRHIIDSQKGRCTELDAVQALTRRGSCTSCANLVTALLRAQGVPARILAGYPSWSGPLQTHYTVEAWVPDYGWYPIESTLLRAPWPPQGQLQVSIVPPEHEDELARPRYNAAGGVPYLSLTEYRHPAGAFSLESAVNGKPHCDHVAEQLHAFANAASQEGWTAALLRVRARWQEWVEARDQPADALATPLTAADLAAVEDLDGLRAVLDH